MPETRPQIEDLPVRLPWFAVRVKSRCEQVAAASLNARGFQEFPAFYQAKRRWSDRIKQVELPLFPGYIFCRFHPLDRGSVVSSPGVVDVIGLGKKPVPIEESEIAAIQAIIASGLPARPWPFLKVGQQVAVQHGPLAGIEGIVVNLKKDLRLVVSVMLLQRSVSVEIDREWIRPY